MLRLFIMRHAKSSWAVPGARDFDRELNDRGLADLALVSDALAKKRYVPAKIVCSSAERTRQTLEGISEVVGSSPDIDFLERLYHGGMENYLEVIKSSENTPSLMIIGHNPMSGTLAFSLVGDGDPELIELISYKYPTACVAVIDFDVSNWPEIGKHKGTLVDCIFPSILKNKTPR